MLVNYAPLFQNTLAFNLKEVGTNQLILINKLEKNVYIYKDNEFVDILTPDDELNPQVVKNIIKAYGNQVFISPEDHQFLKVKIREHLIKITRSMSFGDPVKNGIRQSNLMTMNMSNLYEDPFNDFNLQMQFKSATSLYNFLINNDKKHVKSIFQGIQKQNHHYLHAQPMLSTLIYMNLIRSLKSFTEKEMQNLFLASYFKDIGMSFVPKDHLEKVTLTDKETQIINDHPRNSFSILEGRIPLSKSYLEMIKNHNYLSEALKSDVNNVHDIEPIEILTGVETALLSTSDILVALISDRPYRENYSLFEALNYIKILIADDYPQEFKMFVKFSKQFFT